MSEHEWYSEGLPFECTQCGACCTGAEGYVLVSDDESRAIATRLGVSYDVFLKKYTHMTPAGRSLTERATAHGQDCVFLDRETLPGKAVCSLYEHRPMQCRTFPWWPENLRSERTWARVGRQCEGVGRGRIVPVEAIRIDRDAQRAYDARVAKRAASR